MLNLRNFGKILMDLRIFFIDFVFSYFGNLAEIFGGFWNFCGEILANLWNFGAFGILVEISNGNLENFVQIFRIFWEFLVLLGFFFY